MFDPIESLANMRHEFGEHGGVNMSVEASTTFTVMTAGTMPEIFQGRRGPDEGGCYLYGRHFNPTVYVLGREIAALEGAQAGYCTSSGMSAIASTILQMCDAGDHIVSSDTLYGGTYALFNDYLPPKTNITTTFVPMHNLDAVRGAFTDKTRVLYVESMSNPTLRVADTRALASIAHEHNASLVVDNTFSPLIISPLQLGADVVVHSATKFLNGTSDIIAGMVCGTTDFITSLMDLHQGSLMLLGPTMDPKAAFEISLRLPHIGLRMKEHGKRALTLATRLEDMGIDVMYPGLESHPDHQLLDSIRNRDYGYGGVFSIDMGSSERANALMEHLQNTEHFGYMAVSLGYFDTLMSCSASSTSSEMSDEALREAGISPGLVRISIGYTGSLEQRWEQLHRALSLVGAAS
ncbi:MAG: aminotransferase class I/II-fold pyridoxal phosphate-dependent enzyme [Planctomycetota bacterium]